jgi:hypothetical protein
VTLDEGEVTRSLVSLTQSALIWRALPAVPPYTVGSHFTTGLRSRIFGCKSNRRNTSTI